jgi:sugar O-acyltransferase (sialic acid O-acetyltransferase NeuD family)
VPRSIYAVYGCSGFGREVMPLVRCMPEVAGQGAEVVFIDDAVTSQGRTVNGHRVLGYADFLGQEAQHRFVTIAIADGRVRARLHERVTADGIRHLSVVSASATVLDGNTIGDGSILCGYTHITCNATIGRSFHANIYSYVAHDCVIGDFVTLAPGAKINGNVVVQDHAYIGTGAMIRQGRPGEPLVIGEGAIVGMGAVVTRSVPPGVTVVGNPARPL